MENFDKIVASSLSIASAKALELKNTQLNSLHLLYGLISNPSSFVSKKLKNNLDQIEEALSVLPKSSHELNVDQIRPDGSLGSWLTKAQSNCAKRGATELGEKDLIKFLPEVFPQLDIDYSEFKQGEEEQSEVPSFLINLNEKAEQGKLDPVIGRTKEIRSLMEILGRRSKNNPVLVGEAGVGKTAIVEGLADAIVKDKVPDVLKGKTVYSLELGSLVAGTKFRGDFEERIQNLLDFVRSANGDVILFIDEIHQLIGTGKTDGAMDAANLLKPALSRGELHCIGATTHDEYQKHILKDPALERRFRDVRVNEPSKEDSLEILMGLKDKFEAHHGIKIEDDALYQAVYLSDQYITNKNLPDKAIDILDEAASSLKLSAEAMPPHLEQLKAQIRNKKILSQVEGKKKIEQEIEVLQKQFNEDYTKWESEVSAIKKVASLKNELEELKFQLEKAQLEQDYEKASVLKYSKIPEIEAQINESPHDWSLKKEHIASIIARSIGVPVSKILKTKQESILELESQLSKTVFGQDQALKEISETLMTSYAGLTDETRPLGSFLLKGPTGVGKTQTAKSLANILFSDERNIVRLDLSEYSEKHSVAKLIGAPAGYVGYDEGGILTEAIRRNPYSVILFDEIEKAHDDFADILLQILDEGRLTDNKGRVVNFKNTVIFLTTNSKNVEHDFKPEVLGRLDAIIDYKALDNNVVEQLVSNEFQNLKKRLENSGHQLSVEPEVLTHLAGTGFNLELGARPLKGSFNRLITRPLSKKILAHNDEKTKFEVVLSNGAIEFKESSLEANL